MLLQIRLLPCTETGYLQLVLFELVLLVLLLFVLLVELVWLEEVLF